MNNTHAELKPLSTAKQRTGEVSPACDRVTTDRTVLRSRVDTDGSFCALCIRSSRCTLPRPTDYPLAFCNDFVWEPRALSEVMRYWIIVEEFPMTVTGKLRRFKIREMAIRKLELTDGPTAHTDA